MEQNNTRPRSKSTFSFKSDKSHKDHSHHSPKSHHGRHLSETSEEKRRSHMTSSTKANPNAAMNEAQPIAAALEKPTLQSLRSFQHKDLNGNLIAEPDLSNPTRSRWERPLDTIRSFHAAIDNEYKNDHRRKGPPDQSDPQQEGPGGYGSRRSSYYGGYDQNRDRYSQAGGYYGGRQVAVGRDSYADGGQNGMGPPRSRYNPRHQANGYNNGQGVYPTPGYHQSRDTVNTHNSNGSYSDPNSDENSYQERRPAVAKPDLGEQYGVGFGGAPNIPEYSNPSASYGIPAPAVPTKAGPIKLGGGQHQEASRPGSQRPAVGPEDGDKRKSWFKKRFSKN
ncbi:hypothetical protein GQ43DRAFT_438168 [Delitschia confertaspora ATCC 74209]|uniref:Uncharacterized protein n=1 Tax=Delitschia confertaspora ATCC 74209 TaxID=1513339 RepID=A0A9P4JX79_9PLEO|nr:hypothetical protein GQ43DRAFT_438168 [Delitschia confertaspora ATCC 74209]